MTRRKVIVTGGLGVVGRAAVMHFAAAGWEVVGVSRREPDFATEAAFVSVDLRNPDACATALAPHRDATHVVFAALHEKPELGPGWLDPDQMDTNLAMIRNFFDAVESPALEHVSLLQGTKAYGAHLGGRVRFPAREDEPRVEHDNFYFLQEDFLGERQARRDWSFAIFRPQVVLGVALASAMNVVAGVGAFAVLQRDRGLALDFPSHVDAVSECTDARLLARAFEWAASGEAGENETYNVTNGDVLSWQDLWPRVAAHFGMELGEPKPIRMRDEMPRHAGRWDRLRELDGLPPLSLDALIGPSWQYADMIWASSQPPGRPTLLSTVKVRQRGFDACVDSELAFLELLSEMQAAGYLSR